MVFESFVAQRYLLRKRTLAAIALVLAIPGLDVLAAIVAVVGVLVRVALVENRKLSLSGIISTLSILGINVGVWALICVLSVFNGFNGLVKNLLVGFDPHLRITPAAAPTLDPDAVIRTVRTGSGVVATAPFVSGRSVILNEGGLRAIQIRGLNKRDINSAVGLGSRIVGGAFLDPSPERPHTIVLGSMLALSLGMTIGDTISLVSQSGLEESFTELAAPNIIPCVVTGVFESSNKEYDNYYGYTNLSTARDLFAVPSGAMGVEVRLSNLDQAADVAKQLAAKLGPGYRIETWQDLHSDLFAVMELERWAAFIILSLIIIVAVFNVLGSLTMTVIEKRRDIGVMKTLGASDRSVQRIFLMEGGMIGLIGTAAGVAKGVMLVLLQQHYGLFKLNNAVYIIPALPVDLRVSDLVIVSATALVLAFTASIYPARRAANLLPADAVRWE
jgi:lipoprotein-releasing system permease protein